MDHRKIAVRVPVMNEVQLLFSSEPCKPLKPRVRFRVHGLGFIPEVVREGPATGVEEIVAPLPRAPDRLGRARALTCFEKLVTFNGR
jgi:hypothetical protein